MKRSVDIVNSVLEDCIMAYPVSSFIISLYKQYQQRGSLSKKQLTGLHSKASKIEDYSTAKLATLEAIINKMPNRFKSDKPEQSTSVEKNEAPARMLDTILEKYPQHKRVLFLKTKWDKDGQLSPPEIQEVEKFLDVLKLRN